MKKTYVLFILLILFSCKDTQNTPVDLKSDIADAENNFEENKKNLSEKKAVIFSYSAEGGEVTGYYNKKKLIKLETLLLGETGKVYFDIYFLDNNKIYLVKNIQKYDKHIMEGDVKIISKEITEYLLKDYKIYSLENKEIKGEYTGTDYYKYTKDFKAVIEHSSE